VGVPSTRRFARWFALHHGVAAAVSALPHLIRGASARGILESLRYAARPPAGADALPEAELIAIAVDPSRRGRGIGRALGETLLDALSVRGVDGVRVVVGPDHTAAVHLYERLGFVTKTDLSVHRGTPSRVLVAAGVRKGAMRGTLRRT
jgi:ribosomal protein S18 acetylase RimI-like enzyme